MQFLYLSPNSKESFNSVPSDASFPTRRGQARRVPKSCLSLLSPAILTSGPEGMSSDRPADGAPSALRLDADAPAGQAGVAALYGVSVRKVKRWVAAGREAGDPPPLHAPAEMRAWHDRLRACGIFKHEPGPEFDHALATAEPPSIPAAPPAVLPSDPAKPRVSFRDKGHDEESTDLLTRLQTDERRLHRRYNDAIDQELDDMTIRQYRQHWQEAAELLDQHKSRLKKRGEVTDAEEADAAFEKLVRPLPEALARAFPKEPPPGATWAETVAAAIRQAFARLPATFEEMLN